ncbi:MAG: hypothetical protein J6Y80_04810 [Victivallales bacterium]|nr:hypothetical protein [Victivallales bacterium]
MKQLFILFSLLACATLASFATERLKPDSPNWFPVCAWGFNKEHAPELTQEVFDTMAECGITIAGFANSREELDMIQKAGMVAWILDDDYHGTFWKGYDGEKVDWWEAASNLVAKYSDHPALYGYYIVDEPKLDHFPIVADASDMLRLADPAHERYINLNPNYAPNGYLGTRGYAAHLDEFILQVRPNWFGYDYYNLMEPGSSQDERPTWWQNLADAREAAIRHGIPFQLCVLTVGHLPYRIPSEDDLFFEVFSGLLYGAKGLQFFTYFTPDIGNYRSAPIDLWGHRTQTWYALRNTLCAVHALAPILNQLDSTAVYHLQNSERLPREDEPGAQSLLSGFSGNTRAGLAIGEFRHRKTGETYVMILNKNLDNSISIGGLNWRKKPTEIRVVSQQKPEKFTWFAGEGTWLAPGHAILLKVAFD